MGCIQGRALISEFDEGEFAAPVAGASHRIERVEGVTGLEILARMCALSPRPRVIVITGREDLAKLA